MFRLCTRSTRIVSPFTKPWFNSPTTRAAHTIQRSRLPCCNWSYSPPGSRRLHISPLPQGLPLATKPEYEYTVAQVARAASHAARVAVREGNVRDAYYVVNSMLQSPLEPTVKPPVSSRRLLNPINFGRPVPTRLAVHSLIHSLMREGRTIEAGREIQKMLVIGVRFHPRTLEASVGLLCSGPSRPLENGTAIDDQPVNHAPPPEDSEASRALDAKSTRLGAETCLALSLLSAARRSRHRRTERMYGWLVDACLLQGEIVVATLLFVILVKDWQLRKMLQSSPEELEEAENNNKSTSARRLKRTVFRLDLPSRVHAKQLGLDEPSFSLPYPERSILQNILNSIDRNLFSSDSQHTFRLDSIESLSILANLVDQRSLPFGQISPLIRALSSCPSSPRCIVSHHRRGRHIKVIAYDHVHDVLLRLCRSLPAEKPQPSFLGPEILPRLDTRAYNSLLHYALRHRLSPALANTVIEHMTVHRKPPLRPDVVTYNTLLRSASLLRRNDLAAAALNVFRRRQENAGHVVTTIAPDEPHLDAEASNADLVPASGVFSQRRRRVAAEQMSVPDAEIIASKGHTRLREICADAFTLSSYITHLVSTGRPDVVADMIFHLLPELHVIDHPANDSASAREWVQEQQRMSRRECIQRAVTYGPYVFAAILNALQKACKTGLAERVWLLARQAERASWIPSDRPDAPAPWCLPIHAYTSMMQCYANESKKGVALVRGSRFSQSLSSSLSLIQARQDWEPQATQNGKVYVKGWAYFFLKMQTQEQGFRSAEPPLRWKTSRDVGYLLLKSMRKGAMSVWQELMDLQQEKVQRYPPQWAARLQSLELPFGDARFFNVVLDIFGRRPNMQARRVRASPSWWKKKLRITQQLYGDSGWLSMAYDHTLVEIARGMAKAGHGLPLGLRRALVGRLTFRVRDEESQDDQVQPFGFPRRAQPNLRPFALSVTKTRGLPVGRRTAPASLRPRKGRRLGRDVQTIPGTFQVSL